MKKIINILMLMYLLLIVPGISFGQNAAGDDIEIAYIGDDEVEVKARVNVTADRTAQKDTETVLPVKKVSKSSLEKNIYTSMTDLLDNNLSFASRYEYHSTIYMRGFSGNNIIFLQDGCVRTSTTPAGARANKLNAFNIDHVEIVRGPGSVLYGSGALTGIVNVITKDVFGREWFSGEVKTSYAANNNDKNIYSRVACNTGIAAMSLSGRYRKSDDYTLPDGTEADHSYLEDKDFTLKLGYKPTDKQKIVIGGDFHLGGPWAKAEGFNGKPNLEIYYDKEDSYHYSFLYELSDPGFFSRIQFNAYYDYEDTHNGKKWVSNGGNITSDTITYMEDHYGGGTLLFQKDTGINSFTFGSDLYFYRVWIENEVYDYTIPEHTLTDSIQGGGTNNAGFFVQDRISLSRITILAGARYDVAKVKEGDHHAASLDSLEGYESEKNKNAFSGNFGFIAALSESLLWNLNLGRAFRMPTYSELYSETITGKGIVMGDPSVKPEYSYNIDTGFQLFTYIIDLEINCFMNFYDDLISQELQDPTDGDSGYIYQNVDKARTYGFEVEASKKIEGIIIERDSIMPSFFFTYYRGDNLENSNYLNFSDCEPLIYVPNPEMKGTLNYTVRFAKMSVFIQVDGTYAFAQNRVADTDSPYDPYSYMDLKAGVDISKIGFFRTVKVYLTVKNVTNSEYYLFGDYLPAKGRDFRIMTGAEF